MQQHFASADWPFATMLAWAVAKGKVLADVARDDSHKQLSIVSRCSRRCIGWAHAVMGAQGGAQNSIYLQGKRFALHHKLEWKWDKGMHLSASDFLELVVVSHSTPRHNSWNAISSDATQQQSQTTDNGVAWLLLQQGLACNAILCSSNASPGDAWGAAADDWLG